jgi:Holliday junction DNA helicase RuvA
MIARIHGKVAERRDDAVLLENHGIFYEIFLPAITMARLDSHMGPDGTLCLITYHYHQIEPSRSIPVLIGFLSEIEKEFFAEFIKVSGIGPKAALRAISAPISEIARAIDEADATFLRSLPGIGPQRAKEIVAKLQGKVGRFGLIQDQGVRHEANPKKELIEAATMVLAQLQYKKNEAREMIDEALKIKPDARDIEELLNIVYKQRSHKK